MIHRELGALFATFCILMLGWHILTPENPHHLINLILHSSLAIVFLLSTALPLSFSKYAHPGVLIASSTLVMWGGNFSVGATIVFVAFLLYFAYGGFVTVSIKVVLSSFASIFVLFFIAISLGKYYDSYASAYLMAFIWTAFSIGLFWVVWIAFLHYASDIVQQNRDLLELNKELTKGDCADVTKKRG